MPPRRTTFQPGQIYMSKRMREALDKTGEEITPYLERYLHGDWGILTEEDRKINNEALLEDHGGGSVTGVYLLRDRTQFWIWTSEDRTQTQIMLWDE